MTTPQTHGQSRPAKRGKELDMTTTILGTLRTDDETVQIVHDGTTVVALLADGRREYPIEGREVTVRQALVDLHDLYVGWQWDPEIDWRDLRNEDDEEEVAYQEYLDR